ncbi:hypothetical protein BB560_004382, partial [Smittium megazygosporum]
MSDQWSGSIWFLGKVDQPAKVSSRYFPEVKVNPIIAYSDQSLAHKKKFIESGSEVCPMIWQRAKQGDLVDWESQ